MFACALVRPEGFSFPLTLAKWNFCSICGIFLPSDKKLWRGRRIGMFTFGLLYLFFLLQMIWQPSLLSRDQFLFSVQLLLRDAVSGRSISRAASVRRKAEQIAPLVIDSSLIIPACPSSFFARFLFWLGGGRSSLFLFFSTPLSPSWSI